MSENNDPPSITPRLSIRSNQTASLDQTARSNQTATLGQTARSGQTARLGQTNSKRSSKYNFRIQSAPPLSIQQFLRATTGVIAGAKQWQTTGAYREPIFRAYLSPEVKTKPKVVEPVWHASGRYKEAPPTSLSPEKRPQKTIVLPVWHPPGKFKEEPVSYFDPPSLRWSLSELRRSMPEMRPKTFKATRSTSAVRKSAEIQET